MKTINQSPGVGKYMLSYNAFPDVNKFDISSFSKAKKKTFVDEIEQHPGPADYKFALNTLGNTMRLSFTKVILLFTGYS